jgi:hypothetical protein
MRGLDLTDVSEGPLWVQKQKSNFPMPASGFSLNADVWRTVRIVR